MKTLTHKNLGQLPATETLPVNKTLATATRRDPTRQSKSLLTQTRMTKNAGSMTSLKRSITCDDQPINQYQTKSSYTTKKDYSVKRAPDETASQISVAINAIRDSHGKALDDGKFLQKKLN